MLCGCEEWGKNMRETALQTARWEKQERSTCPRHWSRDSHVAHERDHTGAGLFGFLSLGLQPEGEPTFDQQKCEEEGISERLLTLWYVFVLILITHPPFHCTARGMGRGVGTEKTKLAMGKGGRKVSLFLFLTT